jgi:FkbM family methyltransferase
MKSAAKRIAYALMEILLLGRGVKRNISGSKVRLPVRFSRYYAANYESQTLSFIKRSCKEGDTVFDLGAHLGLITVVMAQCVGPNGNVISFEPTPFTNGILRRTVRINGIQKLVEVRNEAVSNASGVAAFHDTNNQASNANSLVRGPQTHHSVEVATISLDDFAEQRNLRPAVIKIDVEGAELDVLRGATRLLRRFRPALWLALHPDAIAASGARLQDIWDLLQDQEMVALSSGKPVEESWFCGQGGLFDVEIQPSERAIISA